MVKFYLEKQDNREKIALDGYRYIVENYYGKKSSMKFAKLSKRIARRIVIKIANILNMPRIRLSKINCGVILAYHSIEYQWSGYPYAVSKENFEKHMKFLVDNVELVSLEKMFNTMNNSFRVAVTFDDAYEDFFTNVYPILRRMNIPATVFVPTSFISEKKRILEKETRGFCKSHLKWNQMENMQSENIRFESHSHMHISSIKLSEEAFKADLEQSIWLLKKNLGRRPKYFSYPGGGRNSDTDRIALSCGFEKLFGLDNCVAGKDCAGRVSILRENEDIDFFKFKVSGIAVW